VPAVKARLRYAREELKFLVVVCCVVGEEEDGPVLLLNLRELVMAASERCAVAVNDVARRKSSLKR